MAIDLTNQQHQVNLAVLMRMQFQAVGLSITARAVRDLQQLDNSFYAYDLDTCNPGVEFIFPGPRVAGGSNHYFVQVTDSTETFSVVQARLDALQVIADAQATKSQLLASASDKLRSSNLLTPAEKAALGIT